MVAVVTKVTEEAAEVTALPAEVMVLPVEVTALPAEVMVLPAGVTALPVEMEETADVINLIKCTDEFIGERNEFEFPAKTFFPPIISKNHECKKAIYIPLVLFVKLFR